MIDIKLDGLDKATARLNALKESFRSFGGKTVLVGSNLVYAYGIEFGKTRSGRMARRAGGAFMLRNALNAIRPEVDDVFRGALSGNVPDLGMALYKLGLRLQSLAQGQTPVKTGSLRRSMHTVKVGF